MRKKSNKLAKLEKQRYSIFTDKFYKCYYCGIRVGSDSTTHTSGLDIHEVYGGSNRQRSMKYGFCVPLCRKCHSNEKIIADLKKWCQREYEKTHTRQEFISIIGKSYL